MKYYAYITDKKYKLMSVIPIEDAKASNIANFVKKQFQNPDVLEIEIAGLLAKKCFLYKKDFFGNIKTTYTEVVRL